MRPFDSAGGWPWAAAFAMGAKMRFFESGEVRMAILSLLAEGPKHGYQLMKEMASRSGGIYRASAGSVYPTLQQLEDEGLIESDKIEGRRVYRLTDAGRKELEADPETVRRIWRRAERWEDWGSCMGPDVIGVIAPLTAISKAALRAAARVAGKPEAEAKMRQIIDRACAELDQL